MSISVIVAICLGVIAAGEGVALALATRPGRGGEAEAIQAPALAEAETALAVAQWPALQVATAAALQADPPRCAMEYAAYLASIQGGTDGQAMSATDTRGMAEQLQECMAKEAP